MPNVKLCGSAPRWCVFIPVASSGMLEKNAGNLCLHVEVRRSLTGPRFWAWTIYADEYECPIDESRPMFSSSASAMNVGVMVRNHMYFMHGARVRILH